MRLASGTEMDELQAVAESAQRLSTRDEVSLELLIGLRAKAIEKAPALQNDPDLDPKYEAGTMGALDDLKALGRRILGRWNRELYGVVCGAKGEDQSSRKAILESLNLGEAATIAAVAGTLLTIGSPAALAAAVAPLVVKRFVLPAKDELCGAWGEAIKAQG
jgi:hypothetical protein